MVLLFFATPVLHHSTERLLLMKYVPNAPNDPNNPDDAEVVSDPNNNPAGSPLDPHGSPDDASAPSGPPSTPASGAKSAPPEKPYVIYVPKRVARPIIALLGVIAVATVFGLINTGSSLPLPPQPVSSGAQPADQPTSAPAPAIATSFVPPSSTSTVTDGSDTTATDSATTQSSAATSDTGTTATDSATTPASAAASTATPAAIVASAGEINFVLACKWAYPADDPSGAWERNTLGYYGCYISSDRQKIGGFQDNLHIGLNDWCKTMPGATDSTVATQQNGNGTWVCVK